MSAKNTMVWCAIALNPCPFIRIHLQFKKERSPLRQKVRSPFIPPRSSAFICGKKKSDRPSSS
ncbi:hypothetical protein QUB30_25425 [Microcoleus sp. BROC3]